MEIKVYRINELLFIWVIRKIFWVDIFIEPCIIFNMVRFSEITHIQLIDTEKHLNSTCYTKLKFLMHFRWATRAIFKWPGLDYSWLSAAHYFWSMLSKFRLPVSGGQIISRECCSYSLIHFLIFRNPNLSIIDRDLNFLNLPLHFCKKAQLGLDEGFLF